MTPERWEAISEVFNQCLELPESERAAFLLARLPEADDRREVERLMEHHGSASQFLEQSPNAVLELRKASGELAPGTLVARRFRILRTIGSGGMGTVYAAQDEDLGGELLALKVLSASASQDAQAEERFRRELQTARQVTHRNICRLFDYGQDSTLRFLTMELVEGETLEARLRQQTRLPADEAWPWIEQLLDGLAAAHRAGIVHRDLKPANIMLAGPRLVIMDFGLARRAQPNADGLTSTGMLIGTIDYMAPEQLEDGTVSLQTDLYAAGLVLFEMLTGTKPFPGSGSLASAFRRLSQPAPGADTRVSGLPAAWVRAVARCLERDPARRPASAEELAQWMRERRVPGWQPPSRRALVRTGLILAGGVSSFVIGSRLWKWRGTERITTLLVAPTVNSTGLARLDGMTTLLRNQLAQSPHFELISSLRVEELLGRMGQPALTAANAREVALRHGGGAAVVHSTISPLGSEFALAVKVELPGARPSEVRQAWEQAFPAAGEQDLVSRAGAAAEWTRQTLGEAREEIVQHNQPAQEVTTPDWEALRLYSRGVSFRRDKQYGEAVTSLEGAIERDADFVSARSELADLRISLGQYSQGYADWAQAIAAADRRKLTTSERFRLEGLYWDDADDNAKAEQLYRRWVAEYPLDYVPRFYHASRLAALNRLDEAIAQYKASLERRDYFGTWWMLGELALVKGDGAGVERQVARLRAAGHHDLEWSLDGRWRYLQGDAAGALERFRRLRETRDARLGMQGVWASASVLSEEGRLAEAAALLRAERASGATAYRAADRARLLLALANALEETGDGAGARQALDESLGLESGPRNLMLAAELAGRLRDGALLRRMGKLTENWPALPLFTRTRALLEAELFRLGGQRDRALNLARQAARLTPPAEVPLFLSWHGDCQMKPDPARIWWRPDRVLPGALRRLRSATERSHSPCPGG